MLQFMGSQSQKDWVTELTEMRVSFVLLYCLFSPMLLLFSHKECPTL